MIELLRDFNLNFQISYMGINFRALNRALAWRSLLVKEKKPVKDKYGQTPKGLDFGWDHGVIIKPLDDVRHTDLHRLVQYMAGGGIPGIGRDTAGVPGLPVVQLLKIAKVLGVHPIQLLTRPLTYITTNPLDWMKTYPVPVTMLRARLGR